jgi:IMP dehydrogenase
MASIEAMAVGGGKRYLAEANQVVVPQGVSGTVPDKGSMVDYMPYLMRGLKQALQDMGYKSVTSLHEALHEGRLRFEHRTTAAQVEGSVHGLHTWQEPKFGIK